MKSSILTQAALRSAATEEEFQLALDSAKLPATPEIVGFLVEMVNRGLGATRSAQMLRNVLDAYERTP